ncbi:hypothetical protein M422DRAFT_268590 [Sphaerobolus stellatus SS14]|uniref:Uncharacterized protein n=1 Tax=Sphaerobolus stellatus (strain SS14) TaxID=990650 RepID=A0A0C9UXW6_SPHS4|nr:hypothetical protein M422DRAFT_268590 [Sphaerobolus stellatus SS14]
MPEAANDEELQAKLKNLGDKQDAFKEQKDKEKAERSKAGKKLKAGTKKTVQVNTKASGSNAKASGSIPKGSKRKVVSEEDDIEVMSQPKRVRTVVNSDGSVERIPSVAESLHGISKALIYLRGIELSMANLQSAMQTHVAQVHSHMVELEGRVGIWPAEDEEFADEEVEPAGPEDMEEEVEEVREVDEEVREEVEEVREVDKEGREVEDNETMKDPEVDEL